MWRWLSCILVLALAGCDAAKIDACAPGGNAYCGFTKPEDIEIVPGTRWLLISVLGSGSSAGSLVLLDPATDERRTLTEGPLTVADGAPFGSCGAPPSPLRPRGFHLSRTAEGRLKLLVIAGTRVESFSLTATDADAALTWEGCIDIPATITANDVAALPDGGLVVSHMYTPPRDMWLNAKMVLGLDTGYVAKWTREAGWTKVPNTDVSFANGIQVDEAAGRIFVSSMFTQRIISVDLNGGDRRETARTPIQTDNLSWTEDGRLVGAGHTGFPVYGISACRELVDQPCSFPFAVVAFDPKTLSQQELYRTPTGSIPGASVAVVKGTTIYLGSAFGDRVTRVEVAK